MAFLLGRGEALRHNYSHWETPHTSPLKAPLYQGPQSSLSKLNKKGGKKKQLGLLFFPNGDNIHRFPPHSPPGTGPHWRVPWVEAPPQFGSG